MSLLFVCIAVPNSRRRCTRIPRLCNLLLKSGFAKLAGEDIHGCWRGHTWTRASITDRTQLRRMPLNEMNLSLKQMTAPEYLIETNDSAPLWTHGVLSCLFLSAPDSVALIAEDKQAYLAHASNKTSISVAWIPEYSKDKQAYLVHGYHNATETGVSGACRIPAILRFRQCLGHGEAARYSHLSHFMPSCLRKHQVQSLSNTKSA